MPTFLFLFSLFIELGWIFKNHQTRSFSLSMDTDRYRLEGTAAERTAMPSWSGMSKCWAMSRAVDRVAVAVRPNKHWTPKRSLSTWKKNDSSNKSKQSPLYLSNKLTQYLRNYQPNQPYRVSGNKVWNYETTQRHNELHQYRQRPQEGAPELKVDIQRLSLLHQLEPQERGATHTLDLTSPVKTGAEKHRATFKNKSNMDKIGIMSFFKALKIKKMIKRK